MLLEDSQEFAERYGLGTEAASELLLMMRRAYAASFNPSSGETLGSDREYAADGEDSPAVPPDNRAETYIDEGPLGSGAMGLVRRVRNPALNAPEARNVGGGGATVRLHLRSGRCPAARLPLIILAGGDVRAQFPETEFSTVILDEVPADTYLAAVTGPTGAGIGSAEFIVDCADCTLDVRLDIAPGFESHPKGGCSELPCLDGACDTCVAVDVRDEENAPDSGGLVSVFAPIDEDFHVEDDGAICLDLPGAADLSVELAAHAFEASALAHLPRAASCGSGGCAEIALVPAARLSYGDGALFDDALAVELGHFDPRYSNFRDFVSTPTRSRSFFRATVGADDTGALADALSEERPVANEAVALHIVRQDALGQEIVQGLSVRLVLPTSGLGFDLTLPPAAVRGGPFSLADGAATVRIAELPQGVDDTSTYYSSTDGSARVVGIGGGRIFVTVDGVFEGGDESTGISLLAVAPILTQADSPQGLLSQRSHPLNGRGVCIVNAAHPDGYADTMTGTRSEDDFPGGQYDLCIPTDEFYMLRGDDVPGLITPITSLYVHGGDGFTLFGNDDPDAPLFVTGDLRWFDPAFLGRMYEGVGLDPDLIESHGTITGRFADRTGFLARAGRVTLEIGEDVVDAFLIGDDFGPSDDTSIYFFPSVPPTTLDEPYTLRAFRDDSTEIAEFRQLVVPMAGTALIPHP